MIRKGMRPFWIGPLTITVVILLSAACARSPAPASGPAHPSSPKRAAGGTAVNPANIKRVGRELPTGYEVTTAIPSAASPRVIWRLEPGGAAKPPQCAILADPGDGRDESAQGVSGSGSGGIVDAVVVSVPGLPGPLAPEAVMAQPMVEATDRGRAVGAKRETDQRQLDQREHHQVERDNGNDVGARPGVELDQQRQPSEVASAPTRRTHDPDSANQPYRPMRPLEPPSTLA